MQIAHPWSHIALKARFSPSLLPPHAAHTWNPNFHIKITSAVLELRQTWCAHPDQEALTSLLWSRSRGRRSWTWSRGRSARRSCCRHPCLAWSSSHRYRNLAHRAAQPNTAQHRLLQEKTPLSMKPSLKDLKDWIPSFLPSEDAWMLRLVQQGTEHFSPPFRTEISPRMHKHAGFF